MFTVMSVLNRTVMWLVSILTVLVVSVACASGSTIQSNTDAASNADNAARLNRSATETAVVSEILAQQAAPDAPAAPVVSASGPALARLEIRVLSTKELVFQPDKLDVEKAGVYEIAFVNEGNLPHALAFANGFELKAEAGQTTTASVDVPAGGLSFICSIPGHSDAGMKGAVSVGGQPVAAHPGDHQALIPVTGGGSSSAFVPDPGAPPPPFVDATAPELMPGTVHELYVPVIEKDMSLLPGLVQHVWTFNGTVPAPFIRVRVGDTLRIRFENLSTNALPHSLDFHSSEVAVNDEMRTINTGNEIFVELTMNYAGVWMYHCVTGPPVHHVGSGMFGMIIVEPKEGLPPADREFVLVQNEWYFGPQGGLISLEKAMAGAPSPDYMAFNGIPAQYMENPLKGEKGERLRFFVLNVGPNLESSFHIVGMVFDTVIKEGVSLLPGNQGNWGSQAVDLAPAQGAIVETIAPEDGIYEFVTHTFNFHDKGAQGLIQIGDGVPKP